MENFPAEKCLKHHIICRQTHPARCRMRHVSFSAGVALKQLPGAAYVLLASSRPDTELLSAAPHVAQSGYTQEGRSFHLNVHRGKAVTHSKHMSNIQFSHAGIKEKVDPWGNCARLELFTVVQTFSVTTVIFWSLLLKTAQPQDDS